MEEENLFLCLYLKIISNFVKLSLVILTFLTIANKQHYILNMFHSLGLMNYADEFSASLDFVM